MRYSTIIILLILSTQLALSEEIRLQKKCECGRTVYLTLRQVEKQVLVRVRPKVLVRARKVEVRVKTEAEIATEQAAK